MLATGLKLVNLGYWSLIYPADILIIPTVVSCNVVGGALRDALEIRLQRR